MQIMANKRHVGYDTFGEDAQTFVLLHAFPLNKEQWRAQAQALARQGGVRVITPDLRGFGESAVAPGPTLVEDMAGDIFGLLDALHIDDFILGGLSLGGYVAFRMLAMAPERIKGLVLADTKPSADSAEQRAAREATAVFVEQHGTEGAAALIDRDAAKYFAPDSLASRQDVVAEARRIAALNSDIGVAGASRGMGLRPDSTDLLGRIRCPTLVLVGEHDAITPRAEVESMQRQIPTSELQVIPGAGHLSNLEQPDIFAQHLARFLSVLRDPAHA